MKIITYTIVASFVFLFLSCNEEKMSDKYDILIDPSTNYGKYNIASDVEPEFDLLALETTENCLIGEIQNISFHNDKYYILDDKGISVFIFNNKGQFISKLDKKGGGPDEYVRLSNLYIENENIWVFDDMTHRLLCYNKDYILIEEIRADGFPAYDIEFVDENILLGSNYFWSGENSNNLRIYNKTRDITHYFPFEKPKEDIVPILKQKQFAKYDNSVLFTYSYDNIIYEIDGSSINPKYAYKFTERFEDIPLTFEEISKNTQTIRGIESLSQTKQSVLIKFFDYDQPKLAIYDKHRKETKVYESVLTNSHLGNLLLPWYYIVDGISIVCILNPSVLLEYGHDFYDLSKFKDVVEKDKFESIISTMKVDDNPIVLRFKLKETSTL